jgi:cell division protein FtsZ
MAPFQFQPDFDKPLEKIIKVIGVGGGGSNAVNHMYKNGIEGVEFFICNTDNQALKHSTVPNRLQLGLDLTSGLGAGSSPDVGEKAAIESTSVIEQMLGDGTRMIFITAGMGGGTGTGAAPVIASIAKKMGILTVGIVTIPFSDEGPVRQQQAQEGIERLKPHVDALLTISNDRIVDMFGDLTFLEAFSQADDILCTAAKGIAEIIFKPGHINVDFNDVKTAMSNSGHALMGTGIAGGENRAEQAVQKALTSPLLDNTKIEGAKHLLINVSFGKLQPTMKETRIITSFLQAEAGNSAHLKMGITHDEILEDNISVTVIATGFEANKAAAVDQFELDSIIEMQTIQESAKSIEIEIMTEETEPKMAIPVIPTQNPPTTIEELFRTPIHQDNLDESMGNYQNHHPITPRPEKPSIMDNDMNIPAYKRRNIQLVQAPPSQGSEVSKLTLGNSTENAHREFTITPNRMLHDNVD